MDKYTRQLSIHTCPSNRTRFHCSKSLPLWIRRFSASSFLQCVWVHPSSFSAFIAPSSLYDIHNEAANIIEAPNAVELRELFLNLYHHVSPSCDGTTSPIMFVIIGPWCSSNVFSKLTLCVSIIAVTRFYVSGRASEGVRGSSYNLIDSKKRRAFQKVSTLQSLNC